MKKSTWIIGSIALVLLFVIGGTYAFYVWRTNSLEETKIVTSLGAATIYFDGGEDITKTNLIPTLKKEEGIVKNIQVKTNSTSVNNLSFNLYLDITQLGTNLNEESFRFALYQGTTLRYEGNFSDAFTNANAEACTKNNTTHFTLLKNEKITSTLSSYTLYIWVDGLVDNPITMMKNQPFQFHLHADGQNAILKEGKIPDITQTVSSSLAYNLVNMYNEAEKTDVTNNDVVYHYYKEHNMMSDIMGNVRYYGADPDNYIYFNCSDYNNQSDSTCEKWRIIGVFDGKVKIMRNRPIDRYSYDTSITEVNGGRGINQWGLSTYVDGSVYKGADLMKLLNPGYEDNQDLDSSGNTITVNNSLYYRGESGTCYNAISNGTTECTYSSIGLLNDITRNMISDTTYYLGGYNDGDIYVDQMYEYERGTLTGATSDTDNVNKIPTWTGKIALMYPSDYGYASDLSLCSLTLRNYEDPTCADNNWIKARVRNYGSTWFLTPVSGKSYYIWYVTVAGHVSASRSACDDAYVNPVLYLNPDVVVESGTGDIDDPYQIKVS